MGMAGGAYQGDKERAQIALQAAQIANSRAMQERQMAMQERRLQEDARRADMADERANRQLDIQEQNSQLRFEQQNAALQERMRQNDMMDASRGRSLDIREQLSAARQQAVDARLAKLAGQNNVLGQFQQVCDVEQKQTKAKQAHGQATMASMMKIGLSNGGTVPMAALNFANRQFGFDGRNQAIGAAGFMQNGNFFIDFLQKDPSSGQVARNTQVFNAEDMGRVMYSQAGIFTNEDRQKWRESMVQRGYSTDEVDRMSGLNASTLERLDETGRQRLEAGYADPSSDGEWKEQYDRRMKEIKLQQAESKLAKSLGQSGLTPSQKYALYHFNDFASPTAHEATAEDVKAGLAKKVGEQVLTLTSPDQAFQKAVEFYNKNAQNADPAVTPDPDKEGGEPKVVKEPASDPTAVGSEAAPAGDESPTEGNLSHEGRKWKLYTDADGKINGYGTTRSTYTQTDDGKFAVIPTIVDGEELSGEDAVAHYKKTGENWGVVGSEEEAKKLAQKIHLEEQDTNQKAWNDYIHENWDNMSSEITSDEGMIAEHKRRLTEKNGVAQGEFDFGGGEGANAPENGGETPADGGEAPADGGDAMDEQEAPEPKANGENAEDNDAEDETMKNNPFAKWVKRGRGKRK